MKKYLIALLIIVCSCKKEPVVSTDLVPFKIVARDTLTTGQRWGLTIGETAAQAYEMIQNIRGEQGISSLIVVDNVFAKIEDIESRVPRYTSVFLDEAIGTSSGIQVYIADNKVKSIWTNAGTRLSRWPDISDTTAAVAIEDPIENIYQKLLNASRMPAYVKNFERISMLYKDINKHYDSQMSKSPQWYFVTVDDKTYSLVKTYYLVQLNFSSGVLSSIYFTLYERN
jgi:hypothetical protein